MKTQDYIPNARKEELGIIAIISVLSADETLKLKQIRRILQNTARRLGGTTGQGFYEKIKRLYYTAR